MTTLCEEKKFVSYSKTNLRTSAAIFTVAVFAVFAFAVFVISRLFVFVRLDLGMFLARSFLFIGLLALCRNGQRKADDEHYHE